MIDFKDKRVFLIFLACGIIGFTSGFLIGISYIDDVGFMLLNSFCEGKPEKCDAICLELHCQQEYGCWTSGQPPDFNIFS